MTLDEAVKNQVKDNTSLMQKIANYIPIYKGYRQKNVRRDEDRAVRQEVARVLETAKKDLATIQRASTGNVQFMRDTERVRAKADKYYISVKKAAGGYTGFGETLKVTEAELDSLMAWDAKLIDGAVMLKKQTESIVESIDRDGADIKSMLKALETTLDELSENFVARETVMKGLVKE